MLALDYTIRVDTSSTVGWCMLKAEAHIAQGVGSIHLASSSEHIKAARLLPDTRSEMALPLTAGSQVIGALDVQSTESNAFTQEDIDVLTVLADQVSAAIQNSRLYLESREALAQAEAASQLLTGDAWTNVRHFAPLVGYHFDGTKPEPLTQPTNGKQAKKRKDALSVPVQLRNETIGLLHIKPAVDGHKWTEDEIAIISATAERVALAAENARLILESKKTAAKEQVIGEISSKIGASISLDNILQTTLREMGRILPGAEISIQVENE
jgi:GAF domain-containing protein